MNNCKADKKSALVIYFADKLHYKIMKVSKLGIEFEGEFIKDITDYEVYSRMGANWSRVSDGSIYRQANGYCKELVSKPFVFADLSKIIGELEILESDNKKVAFANDSAGTHIHISFENDSEYCYATSFKVYEKFISAYKKEFELPKYAQRLAKTDMCSQFRDTKEFLELVSGQLTARDKDGNRYKVFNFCKNLHGTLEIRIFPYMTTLDGLKKVVEFVYKFFSNLKVQPYQPLDNILKHDKLAINKNSVAGAMLQNFTTKYTRAREKMYFDVKCLPFDMIKFVYHTTPITLHMDD